MASQRFIEAAVENIKKAQQAWQQMSRRERAQAQPEGRGRARPGTWGGGEYYRVVVRPKDRFSLFRIQDVGRSGHSKRLAGQKSSGSWATQAWLISKKDAHVEKGKLVADDPKVKRILDKLPGREKQIKGDVIRGKPRRNIPERKKTRAQKRARGRNIRKAQAAKKRKRKR